MGQVPGDLRTSKMVPEDLSSYYVNHERIKPKGMLAGIKPSVLSYGVVLWEGNVCTDPMAVPVLTGPKSRVSQASPGSRWSGPPFLVSTWTTRDLGSCAVLWGPEEAGGLGSLGTAGP